MDRISKQAERDREFKRAMMAHDLKRAREIVRLVVPANATERQRAEWGARRELIRLLED